jgi:hypothetical protein
MSRTPKIVDDKDAREIAEFLLNKQIPQNKIANTVTRSQSWVAGVKREIDLADSAREIGRQEVRSQIIENVEKKAAKELIKSIPQPMVTFDYNSKDIFLD